MPMQVLQGIVMPGSGILEQRSWAGAELSELEMALKNPGFAPLHVVECLICSSVGI